MATLLEVNAQYRAALAANEAQAVADLTRAYRLAWGHLQGAVDALAERVATEPDISPFAVYQLAHYRTLEAQLADLMDNGLTRIVSDTIEAQQAAAARIGASAAIAQIEALLGPEAADALSIARLPDSQLRELQGFLAPGSPLSTVLDKLGETAAAQVRDGLIRGITLGLGPRQIAASVRDGFGGNLTSALRYSRTATQYAARSSQLEHYKANDDIVRGVTWTAACDRRTCAACWALQGKFFPLGHAPLRHHWNCRCSLSPVTRNSRVEVETGAKLFEDAGEATQRTVLGRAGYEAYRRGALGLEELLGSYEDKTLGSVFARRSLSEALGAGKVKELLAATAKNPKAPAKPQGTAVSAAFPTVPGGKVGKLMRQTLGVIDSVHGDGVLPELPVKTTSGTRTLGSYRYTVDGTPVDMHVSARGNHQLMTIAHETGHFLDQQGIGQRFYASQDRNSTALAPTVRDALNTWYDSVQSSAGVTRLKEMYGQRALIVQTDHGPENYRLDRKYMGYLLRDQELFARSYAQYIAERSGDVAMMEELGALQQESALPLSYPNQWQRDDFEPIATAFDTLFAALGWRA